MTRYVVGLMFDHARTRVVLVRKRRPEWQVNRLTGPGGKVEETETMDQAMVREFREETGQPTQPADWELVVLLQVSSQNSVNGERCEVGFYRTFQPRSVVAGVRTQTDEPVFAEGVSSVLGSPQLVPNLQWILPLAADPCCELPLVVMDAPSVTRADGWAAKQAAARMPLRMAEL